MKKIRIGLLGLGQVGSGVYRLLSQKAALFKAQTGVELEITKILVRNPRKKRLVSVPARLLTTRAKDILQDPSIRIVVELVGGITPAESWYLEAFRGGKDVVTANKALLAERGERLFEAARRYHRQIFFEASVAGGIPVIKSLREGLVANRIESLSGIVNGTSNYILTQMSQQKISFKTALRLAQDNGFAEADPSFDVRGIDAAHKLAILVRLAFKHSVDFTKLQVRGIESISEFDIDYAKRFGYVIKLIAQAKQSGNKLLARVEPLLLKEDHILAKVDGAFNAILFKTDEVGDFLLYGQGAGSKPTASAVVNDLCDLVQGRQSNFPAAVSTGDLGRLAGPKSRYYLRFSVTDQPGVLAQIAKRLGKEKVSIADVIQFERKIGNSVPLIMVTHHSEEDAVERAVQAIDRLSSVKAKSQKIRIEDQ